MVWPFAGDLPDRKLTQDELEALFGTPEECRAASRRFQANHSRRDDPDIRRKYGGQFVAILDGKVVAHGPTSREMLQDALWNGITDAQGWVFDTVAPGYVRPCPPTMRPE